MLLKLVFDTNTLVSAFFWEGNESKLFRKIEQEKVLLFISQEILKEVEEVIKRPKFKQTIVNANLTPDQIIQKIVSASTLVIGPKLNIKVCRDREDNKFLECAEHAKADYLVTGDNDLLKLKKHKKTKIIKTNEILKLL